MGHKKASLMHIEGNESIINNIIKCLSHTYELLQIREAAETDSNLLLGGEAVNIFNDTILSALIQLELLLYRHNEYFMDEDDAILN